MSEYNHDLAQQLKAQYMTSDPFELIEAHGIHLLLLHGMGRLKGLYTIQQIGEYEEDYIAINAEKDEREQRGVAAHELAHAFLDRDVVRAQLHKDYYLFSTKSKMEYRANLLASEILIEDEEIMEMVEDGTDYIAISQMLGCHPQFVCFKLKSMIDRGYNYRLPVTLRSNFLAM